MYLKLWGVWCNANYNLHTPVLSFWLCRNERLPRGRKAAKNDTFKFPPLLYQGDVDYSILGMTCVKVSLLGLNKPGNKTIIIPAMKLVESSEQPSWVFACSGKKLSERQGWQDKYNITKPSPNYNNQIFSLFKSRNRCS